MGRGCLSYALPGDTAEVISLWQTTFSDSDKFVDLFFSRVYKPENTLVIKSGNRIVSALQMIPYETKIANDIIPSAYICGVCTRTSERGKGLMSILMAEAIGEMRQKGYGITTLIPAQPWLFDVYKKYGYTHPINYSIEMYSRETRPGTYTFIPYTSEYFPYFDRKQRERQCAVLHDADDVENIVSDLTHDSGNAWIALNDGIPVGIAFVGSASENAVVIKEILCDNTQIKDALIHNILNTYNAQTAEVRVPAYSGKIYPYGLACVLDKNITNLSGAYMTMMLD